MSVRVSDRHLSRMEYIHNAQQLLFLIRDRVTKYSNKVNKTSRYRHFTKSINYPVWNSPIFHAQMVYQYCLLANRTSDSIKRLEYLDNASQNLMLLEAAIETMYSQFKSVIKDKFIILVTEKDRF